jgi:tetratricopeptide (TPR) repeat protein
VGTFALIFLAIAALFTLDVFLANIDRGESRAQARHLYIEGLKLASRGQPLDAVDRFRSAVAAERSNPVYQRALAWGLLSAGKVEDAEAVATERLEHDPADAGASLIMAQALAREGKLPRAISYYHRAIYGQWANDQARNRLRARFELVDLLARQDSLREDLLAELLPLQREAPGDLATRARIARLLTAAGSPSSAIEIFREILRHDRRNADAYAGLGEAEFERGNYRTALADFTAAARLDQGNRAAAAGLARTNQVLGLDPTQRGLGIEEQYRRSQALLQLTSVLGDSCATVDSVRALADSARLAAKRRPGTIPRYRMVEQNLDLAERLWQLRRKECPAPVPESEKALALVLDKIAQ